MHSAGALSALCVAGIVLVTSSNSLCMFAAALPLSSKLSAIHTPGFEAATTPDDHKLLKHGPLDKVLDRSYSNAVKKGERRWANAISPATKQRTADFLRWNALVVEKGNEGTKQGLSDKQSAAKNSGWVHKPVNSQTDMDDVTRDYPAAQNGARLTTENSRNIAMVHEATDARYKGLYSPSNGLMIAYERHGPQYQASTHSHVQPSDIPEITQWSDVAFLTWMYTISELGLRPAEAPLKQIFIGPITNSESRDVIKKAIKEAGHKGEGLPSFEKAVELTRPGTVVQKKDRPFMAVSGTDNLAGVGYLLAQHQQTLGKKGIGSLLVFGKRGNLYVKVEIVDQK